MTEVHDGIENLLGTTGSSALDHHGSFHMNTKTVLKRIRIATFVWLSLYPQILRISIILDQPEKLLWKQGKQSSKLAHLKLQVQMICTRFFIKKMEYNRTTKLWPIVLEDFGSTIVQFRATSKLLEILYSISYLCFQCRQEKYLPHPPSFNI